MNHRRVNSWTDKHEYSWQFHGYYNTNDMHIRLWLAHVVGGMCDNGDVFLPMVDLFVPLNPRVASRERELNGYKTT